MSRTLYIFGLTIAVLGTGRAASAGETGPASHRLGVSSNGWEAVISAQPVSALDPAWSATITRRTSPLIATAALPSHAAATGPRVGDAATSKGKGIASFYWQGVTTASGEPFDKTAMTAAHPSLPFNTRVRVTHLANGRSVVVRINDRGPFKPGRVIDLSEAAADALGMRGTGLAEVGLEVVSN